MVYPILDHSLKVRSQALLSELGLLDSGESVQVEPLTGGVSSDIARVKTDKVELCTKFALSHLKVEVDWQAPIQRNASEYAWLKFVSKILPENVPKLYGRSQSLNGFVMECLNGENVRLWKSDLLENGPQLSDVEKVAHTLGCIHQASSQGNLDQKNFQNADNFYSLRLEPYFAFMMGQYPKISESIKNIIHVTEKTNLVLIHGDVSPKNILFNNNVPVFLDAECATMGDPAFDVGFCMNHLLIKSVHMPHYAQDLIQASREFWHHYRSKIMWEPRAECERRLLLLLPLLMLARVDSKSPVEYLNESSKSFIRSFAIPLIEKPAAHLDNYLEKLSAKL